MMSKNISQNASISLVAQQNDIFRKELIGSLPQVAIKHNQSWKAYIPGNKFSGMLITTQGVFSLPDEDKIAIHIKVVSFDDFTKDNDPYGEQDFGIIKHKGEEYYWKIDYYDLDYEYHSPDKENTDVTRRVLTIMHCMEY